MMPQLSIRSALGAVAMAVGIALLLFGTVRTLRFKRQPYYSWAAQIGEPDRPKWHEDPFVSGGALCLMAGLVIAFGQGEWDMSWAGD